MTSPRLVAESTVPFIVVIPARRASTRLPGKPLADIAGKPMVVHVAARAVASGAKSVVVATDDREIESVVAAHGYQAMLTRADHSSGTDRIAEVAMRLNLADDSIVVNVQGDEPLIPPGLIANAAAALAGSPDCAIATARHAIESRAEMFDPNVVKVVVDSRGHALYFSRAPIPWARDAFANAASPASAAASAAASVAAFRHIGLYAYRAAFLSAFAKLLPSPLEELEALEQLRALWHGYRIAVFETDTAPPPGVDTPADLERVRAHFAGVADVPSGRSQ